MNRITPEMVLEAYRVTGWKPVQDEWFEEEHKCACGLSAVSLKKHGKEFLDNVANEGFADEVVENLLELDSYYVGGFTYGFDGHNSCRSSEERAKQGFEDGKACWEAVKHLSEEESK